MHFKYEDNLLNINNPYVMLYLKDFINKYQEDINKGNIANLIATKCHPLYRAEIIKLLLTSELNGDIFDSSIPMYAFQASDLLEITTPKNVQIIGESAFESAHFLYKVEFEPGSELHIIQSWAFKNCISIEAFKCPENLIHLDSEAFKNCNDLILFYLNNKLQSIGRSCFSGCKSLKNLIFKGTKKEFEYVDLDDLWLEGSEIKKIICNDGVIDLW